MSRNELPQANCNNLQTIPYTTPYFMFRKELPQVNCNSLQTIQVSRLGANEKSEQIQPAWIAESHNSEMHQMNVEIDTGAGCNMMPLYKVKELFGQEWLVQRLSPPTVRIKAYGDQEVKVLGSIVLYIHTKEKTYRVTWQVTDTTGVPILGRSQAKHMNYINYPEIHVPQQQPPVSQSSLKSTGYIHSLETVQHSLQSDPKFDQKLNQSKFNQTAQSMDSLQTSPKFDQKFNQTAQQEHRAATKAKSGTDHKPKSSQVAWCESSITINGKTHLLPTTKEYILHEYADVFKGGGTLPGGPYHIKLKDSYKPVQHPPRSVPLGMQSAYKAELDRLVKEGIITEVLEHTEWINSISPVIADILSRVCPLQSSNSMIKESNIDVMTVHHTTQIAPVSQTRLQKLRLATQSDPTLQNLSKIIHEGWPQSKKDCPKQLLEFWNFRQETSEENGILYKNHRLIVPHSE